MNIPKIEVCKKICNECGFNCSTKNTLYANFYNIMYNGVLFPCHKYLKSQTGNESYGTETLKEVKVCRGYIAFMKKYNLNLINSFAGNYPRRVKVWQPLLDDIKEEELREIYSLNELKYNHIGLRDNIYINNKLLYP